MNSDSETNFDASRGWVRLWRGMLDSRLWSFSDSTLRVAIYLILSVNHQPRFHRGITISAGQCVRSLTMISEDCNLSRKAVRHALKKLGEENFIKLDEPFEAHQGHRITICKWDTYQPDEEVEGTRGARKGHTRGTEGNTNKNEKNEKNEKNIAYAHLEDGPVPPQVEKGKLLIGDQTPPETVRCEPSEKRITKDVAIEVGKVYNEVLGSTLPKLRVKNDSRIESAKRLFKILDCDLGEVRKYFESVKRSDFLCGRTRDPWKGCNFDWLTKQANAVKVIEGNYHR